MVKKVSLLLTLFFECIGILAQKYVKDSVILNFNTQPFYTASIYVDTVIDNREELKGNELRISEKTRYVFIPVDRYFVTEKTLRHNIHSLFTDQRQDTSYKFIIDEFEISHRNGILKGTQLSAKIQVYEGAIGEAKHLKGTLLYQTKGQKPKNKTLVANYEKLLDDWQRSFLNDMYRIKSDTSCNKHSFAFYNYRPMLEKVPTRLYLSTFAAVGLDWWLTELEFGFYDPEVTRKFMYQTNYIQYRWTKRFESLALGKDAAHFCYRLNHQWIAEAVPQISLGFNHWKDWGTCSHNLYDLFNISCSFREDVQFNPFDKKSILFTVGLIQDLYYTYSTDWKFNPGLMLGFGYKF